MYIWMKLNMNLTMINKIKLCLEILTAKSGHKHQAQEKMLSTFQRGYAAGVNDERLSNKAVKRDKAAELAIKKRQQARKMLERIKELETLIFECSTIGVSK